LRLRAASDRQVYRIAACAAPDVQKPPFLRQFDHIVNHLIEGLTPGGRDVQVVEISHFFSVSHCTIIALHNNTIVANQTRRPQEPPLSTIPELNLGLKDFVTPPRSEFFQPRMNTNEHEYYFWPCKLFGLHFMVSIREDSCSFVAEILFLESI